MHQAVKGQAELAFFENFTTAVIIFDRSGRIHATNAEWNEKVLLGRDRSPDFLKQTFTPQSLKVIEKAAETIQYPSAVQLDALETLVDQFHSSQYKMVLTTNRQKTHFFLTLSNVDRPLHHERDLNALVQSLDEIVFEVDEDGVYRNAWVADDAQIFFPKETFLSKSIPDLLPYTMANRLMRALRKAVETDAVTVEEIPSPSDPSVWFRYRFAPIRAEKGRQRSVTLSIQNISDLKRAQSKLLESEELHRMVVKATKDAIWDWNLQTNEVTVNRRWMEMVAGEHKAISSGTRRFRYDEISRAIFNDDKHLLEIQARNQMQDEESSQTIRLHGKDGRTVWVLTRGSTIVEEDGKPARWIGAFTDITELYEAQSQLANEKNRLEFIASHIPIMLAEFDENDRCVWANSAFKDKPDWLDFDKNILQFLHDATVDWRDYSLTDEKGVVWETSWCATTLPNGHRIVIGQDITERNRKLLDSFHTSKLVTLGEIAGGVAHEINNPLAVILGQTDIFLRNLKKGPLQGESLEKGLDRVRVNAHRIAKIVAGLRTFARDGSDDPIQDVSPTQLLDNLRSLVHEKAEHFNIELRIKSDFSGTFDAKPTQVLQALLNIVQNSFDAVVNVQGERFIEVKAHQRNNTLAFTIVDSGVGIPDALKPKLMQPFFTTKPVGDGVGLGLAASFGIVKQLNGSLILVESNPGRTVFELSFPLSQRQRNDQAAA